MRGRREGEEDFPRQADPSVQRRGDIREHCAWKEMQIVLHKQVQRAQGTCLGRGHERKPEKLAGAASWSTSCAVERGHTSSCGRQEGIEGFKQAADMIELLFEAATLTSSGEGLREKSMGRSERKLGGPIKVMWWLVALR